MSNTKDWKFNHDAATATEWTPGLREIFQYRDLGYVLNGWATFEYAGQGQETIRKGDCINQIPASRIASSLAPRISR
jgi:hypothetical protein